jgi:hypothetical protein
MRNSDSHKSIDPPDKFRGGWLGGSLVMLGFLFGIGVFFAVAISRDPWQTNDSRHGDIHFAGSRIGWGLSYQRFETWWTLKKLSQPPPEAHEIQFTNPGPYPSRWTTLHSWLGLAYSQRSYIEYSANQWSGELYVGILLDRVTALFWTLFAASFAFPFVRRSALWWCRLPSQLSIWLWHRPTCHGFPITPRGG